jgi:hypothetical protein
VIICNMIGRVYIEEKKNRKLYVIYYCTNRQKYHSKEDLKKHFSTVPSRILQAYFHSVISQYILDTTILAVKSSPMIRSQQHSTQHRLQIPILTGSHFYSLLPMQLKTMTEINIFSNKLKKYLIQRP